MTDGSPASLANDLLLLMVNLGQLRERWQILSLFRDALAGLGLEARFATDAEPPAGAIAVPIEALGQRFGMLVLEGDAHQLGGEQLAAVSNAAAVLALVLQNLERAERLESRHQQDRRALDEQEATFRELFEHMSAGAAIYRPLAGVRDLAVEDLNQAGLQAAGLERHHVLGRRATEVFPGIAASGLLEVLLRVAQTGVTETVAPSRYRDERLDLWVTNTVSCLPSGKVVAIFEDVSDRIAAERRLRESEGRYRFLAEHTSDVIWILSPELRFTYVSPSVEKMRGYTPDEALAQHLDGALTPRSLALFLDRLVALDEADREGVATPGVLVMELEQPCKDGTTVWTEATVRRVLDDDDQVVSYVGSSRDIGDRRRAQGALRESEHRFELAIDGSRGGLWDMALDPDRDDLPDAMYLSPRMKAILGYADDELPGSFQAWKGHIVEEDVPQLEQVARAHLRNGRDMHEIEYRVRTRDGEIRWVMSSGRVERDADGRAIRWTGIVWDITDRKLAEISIRESEARYRRLFDDAVLGIFRSTPEGRLLEVNRAYARMFGYDSPSRMLVAVRDVGSELYKDPDQRPVLLARALAGQGPYLGEVHYRRRDGSDLGCHLYGWPVVDPGDGSTVLEGFVEDVSDRRALEDQLRQSQKLEAIGLLAGGIAHDFNNILQAILGNVEIAVRRQGDDGAVARCLGGIRDGAEKAAALTRQLLAFSRRQVLQRSVIDLEALVTEMLAMLRRIVGEHLELRFVPGPDVATVLADRGQLEQAVMNLVVNARDAMPHGGTITVSTHSIVADAAFCGERPWASPGAYSVLEVADTGDGMDADTLGRIFEPFFTTKELGRGTGLGLSTVYGIVDQHGGGVEVDSELGCGSRFTIFLPASDRAAPESRPGATAELEGGYETVLLAEDEDAVRELTVEALRDAGYTVLAAHDGSHAAQLWAANVSEIKLAILDVVMPGLSGQELLSVIRRQAPRLPVLFSSGYSVEAIRGDLTADPHTELIEKPYALAMLLATVRHMLDT